MDNKTTGSFYTPVILIEYMVEYVSNRIKPRNILEPSAGDGRFLNHLLKFNSKITLIENDLGKSLLLKELYSSLCNVKCIDYLEYQINNKSEYDLIIGNPPYISKKGMLVKQRNLSMDIIRFFNLEESLFQNIWVVFILQSIKLLSSDGTIFFVLPFEFLQVKYAEKLRNFLETKFKNIEITTFQNKVFSEIDQDVCLVYLSNQGDSKPYIQYTTLLSISDPSITFQSVIMRNKPLKKWSNCILNDFETEKLIKISNMFPKIKTFGEISPGIVTGANSYFILAKNDLDYLSLDTNYYIPIISKASNFEPLLIFNQRDFSRLEQANKPIFLLNLNGTESNTYSLKLNTYIKRGQDLLIDKRYKCKLRNRWFDVPIIKNGDVYFFKRFYWLPKIVVNECNIHTTDIAYNIRFFEKQSPRSFAFCFYNSLTLALCEYNGRFYSGGVGELTPNEFKDLSIPYKIINEADILKLDNLFRIGETYIKIIDYVDSIVLNCLNPSDIFMLQDIRNRYIQRRMKIYNEEEIQDE